MDTIPLSPSPQPPTTLPTSPSPLTTMPAAPSCSAVPPSVIDSTDDTTPQMVQHPDLFWSTLQPILDQLQILPTTYTDPDDESTAILPGLSLFFDDPDRSPVDSLFVWRGADNTYHLVTQADDPWDLQVDGLEPEHVQPVLKDYIQRSGIWNLSGQLQLSCGLGISQTRIGADMGLEEVEYVGEEVE